MAMWLCRQVQYTQQMIETHWVECRGDLRRAGLGVEDDAGSRLVRVDEEYLTTEVRGLLASELGRSEWVILHVASGQLRVLA